MRDRGPGESNEPQTGTVIVAVGSLALIAGLVLARPLGELIQPAPLGFWPEAAGGLVDPEPTELVRFALAVVAPLVIAALVLFGRRGEPRLAGAVPLRVAATLGATLGLVLIGAGWIARSEPAAFTFGLEADYFGTRDLLLALSFAAVLTAIALGPRSRSLMRRLARDSARLGRRHPVLMSALVVGVVAATALYASPTVYTDANLGDAPELTGSTLPFTFADFTAFGNGATPLADFAAQYANLLPWALHPVLSAFDYSPGAFTVVMTVLSATALLALWRAMALAVGNELAGAALYLPVLALSFRPTLVIGDERMSNASLVQILPERYLLPCVLAWLCVRHVRGSRPRSPTAVLLVASLAVLNNPEFGIACLLATVSALLVGTEGSPGRELRRVGVRLLAGALLAVAVVSVATLTRSGSVPDPTQLTYFSRFFAAQGFGLQPMPVLGFHLIMYVTFAGAAILAATRRRAGHPGRALSALLAYSGTFGLGAGVYYAGRSNAITMVALFPAWGLSVALLTWVTVRWLLGWETAGRS